MVILNYLASPRGVKEHYPKITFRSDKAKSISVARIVLYQKKEIKLI